MRFPRPKSLSGLMLVGFTIVAAPLLFAILNAGVQMNRLSNRSEQLVLHGVRATRSNQLLSSVTSAAVDSAFNTLAQTVLVQNARTLEDLVREMLRPMLKAWLDDNLPGMVERLVRAEIERVSRGRMG